MEETSRLIVKRPEYMDALLSWKDKTDTIKIVTGIRRCGKSTLFEMFRLQLQTKYKILETQIQAINFEDANYFDLLNWQKLHDHIQSKLVAGKMNYIFLDEIQNVPSFEKTVNSLRLRKNVDIYITGSNSKILSGELATILSGRYITIHMLPFSFKEYMTANSLYGIRSTYELTLGNVFQDYLQNSGFPYAAQMLAWQNDLMPVKAPLENKQVRQFLKSLLDSIILKDIAERKNVKDISRLLNVIRFMFDNIGNETSILNIKNMLVTNNLKMDVATIENYLDGLMDAFVLYKTNRYDVKGKQYLKTNAKYYLADIGLRYSLLGRGGDIGHVLENVVFLELLRRGYEVSIGKIGVSEVDFVAVKNGSVEYYQVAYAVSDESTRERELKALDAIKDHNPKFLLTMDEFVNEYKGIKVLNVLKWLLD